MSAVAPVAPIVRCTSMVSIKVLRRGGQDRVDAVGASAHVDRGGQFVDAVLVRRQQTSAASSAAARSAACCLSISASNCSFWSRSWRADLMDSPAPWDCWANSLNFATSSCAGSALAFLQTRLRTVQPATAPATALGWNFKTGHPLTAVGTCFAELPVACPGREQVTAPLACPTHATERPAQGTRRGSEHGGRAEGASARRPSWVPTTFNWASRTTRSVRPFAGADVLENPVHVGIGVLPGERLDQLVHLPSCWVCSIAVAGHVALAAEVAHADCASILSRAVGDACSARATSSASARCGSIPRTRRRRRRRATACRSAWPTDPPVRTGRASDG